MSVVDADVRAAGLSVRRAAVPGWHDWYITCARVMDAAFGLIGVSVAIVLANVVHELRGIGPRDYVPIAVAALLLWVGGLGLNRVYEPRFAGSGAEELRRVMQVAGAVPALIALASFVFEFYVPRTFVLSLLGLYAAAGLVSRRMLRRRLHALRYRGQCMQRVVAVGHASSVAETATALAREQHHGLQVVAACLPSGSAPGQPAELLDLNIPSVGGYADVMRAVELSGADTVALLGVPDMPSAVVRRLAWELEAAGISLLVAPGLVEVTGPRLSLRPAAGLSLLHVEPPARSGGRLVVKTVLDRSAAALALLVLSPLFALVALLIKLEDRGPVFFAQSRIGAGGRTFRMWKFRSMHVGADRQQAELALLSDTDGMLFKIRRDPRVTRVGARLRRWSLDELPQLWNVVTGDMSLVGPRPPLPDEVARYDSDAYRRLLVRPGMTGLWQVSGRADLSWEETLRLDLRYIDNWSLALDLLVLWKTGRAVVRGSGAY